MDEKIFLEVLFETKVNAIRHHTKDEAADAVRKIKDAIKVHRFEICDRDKNLDFLRNEHLNKEMACKVIDMFLEPKNLIAIIPNRNKDGKELYLFSLVVPVRDRKKYIYLKVEITSYGKVYCISFHGQNEKMHADYRQATDSPDNYILEKMATVWQKTYNKFGQIKLLSATVNGDDITFHFEQPVDESDRAVITDLAKAIPKDFGYKFVDVIRNNSFEDGDIVVNLPFGHF